MGSLGFLLYYRTKIWTDAMRDIGLWIWALNRLDSSGCRHHSLHIGCILQRLGSHLRTSCLVSLAALKDEVVKPIKAESRWNWEIRYCIPRIPPILLLIVKNVLCKGPLLPHGRMLRNPGPSFASLSRLCRDELTEFLKGTCWCRTFAITFFRIRILKLFAWWIIWIQ